MRGAISSRFTAEKHLPRQLLGGINAAVCQNDHEHIRALDPAIIVLVKDKSDPASWVIGSLLGMG
jgi:hypothetical protein